MSDRILYGFYLLILTILAVYHTTFFRPMQGGGVDGLLGIGDAIIWILISLGCAYIYVVYIIIRKLLQKVQYFIDKISVHVWIALDVLVIIILLSNYHLTMVDIQSGRG